MDGSKWRRKTSYSKQEQKIKTENEPEKNILGNFAFFSSQLTFPLFQLNIGFS